MAGRWHDSLFDFGMQVRRSRSEDRDLFWEGKALRGEVPASTAQSSICDCALQNDQESQVNADSVQNQNGQLAQDSVGLPSLPDHLDLLVLSFLTAPSDLLAASHVCVLWRRLCASLWPDLFHRVFGPDKCLSELDSWKKHGTSLDLFGPVHKELRLWTSGLRICPRDSPPPQPSGEACQRLLFAKLFAAKLGVLMSSDLFYSDSEYPYVPFVLDLPGNLTAQALAVALGCPPETAYFSGPFFSSWLRSRRTRKLVEMAYFLQGGSADGTFFAVSIGGSSYISKPVIIAARHRAGPVVGLFTTSLEA